MLLACVRVCISRRVCERGSTCVHKSSPNSMCALINVRWFICWKLHLKDGPGMSASPSLTRRDQVSIITLFCAIVREWSTAVLGLGKRRFWISARGTALYSITASLLGDRGRRRHSRNSVGGGKEKNMLKESRQTENWRRLATNN